MIENGLHWVLDVTYQQDRTHCRNADFLAGQSDGAQQSDLQPHE